MRKNRSFILLLSGQTLSQFGTAVTTFAIPWLLLELTGSAVQTGIAFVIGFVPYILLSLPAGVWADKWNRKTLMLAADAGRLALLLSIPITRLLHGHTLLWLLYIAQAGVSACSAVFDAAYGSAIPNLVGKDHLQEANNLLQIGVSISRIGGPIAAGILVPLVGTANTLLLDVATYGISIATVFGILQPFSASRTKPGGLNETRQSFLTDLRAGLQAIWQIRAIRYLALLSMLLNLAGPGMDVSLLYRIQHELGLPARWGGIVMTGLGAGMLLGGLVNRWTGRRLMTPQLLTISTALLVLPPFALALATNPDTIVLIQIVIGLLLVVWNVFTVTLRQTLIPDHLRGRCNSIFRLQAWILVPVGDALAGVLSQAFGSSAYFRFAGVVLFIVFVLTTRLKLQPGVNSEHSVVTPGADAIQTTE